MQFSQGKALVVSFLSTQPATLNTCHVKIYIKKTTTPTTNKTKQFKQHQLQQQQYSYRFIGLCELFQYTQLIKEPTRVTSSTKSLIDLFLTNEPV